MQPKQPKQEEIIFLQKKDGYTVTTTETDVFIQTPNGAYLYIPYHINTPDRYTLNYDEISCTKKDINAYVIYCDVVDALQGDLSWGRMKKIIDDLVNKDICCFPFV